MPREELANQIRASATWGEIHAQPAIWRSWADLLDVDGLRAWIDGQGFREVWFCGAGTSAYIGDILAAGLPKRNGLRFLSVPSTDIVARPRYFLQGAETPLIVNFGRSGNSSETVGTLRAIESLAPNAGMLNITCNTDSALARSQNGRTIVLPEACHDSGFAMTSSFTTMLLTALSIFDHGKKAHTNLELLANRAEASLPALAERISTLDRPSRAVFVGSGAMTFAARESALKVMELSVGEVPALWDSTLGFRHGPKSFVAKDSAIFILLNPDKDPLRYDLDLVEELRGQFPHARTITIGSNGDLDPGSIGSPVWDTVLSVLPAQLASVTWSAQLGHNIDDPFVGRSTLSRVVSGVRLYPIEVA